MRPLSSCVTEINAVGCFTESVARVTVDRAVNPDQPSFASFGAIERSIQSFTSRCCEGQSLTLLVFLSFDIDDSSRHARSAKI